MKKIVVETGERIIRCDSCLCEIVDIAGYEEHALGKTSITDIGRVDLCVMCIGLFDIAQDGRIIDK